MDRAEKSSVPPSSEDEGSSPTSTLTPKFMLTRVGGSFGPFRALWLLVSKVLPAKKTLFSLFLPDQPTCTWKGLLTAYTVQKSFAKYGSEIPEESVATAVREPAVVVTRLDFGEAVRFVSAQQGKGRCHHREVERDEDGEGVEHGAVRSMDALWVKRRREGDRWGKRVRAEPKSSRRTAAVSESPKSPPSLETVQLSHGERCPSACRCACEKKACGGACWPALHIDGARTTLCHTGSRLGHMYQRLERTETLPER